MQAGETTVAHARWIRRQWRMFGDASKAAARVGMFMGFDRELSYDGWRIGESFSLRHICLRRARECAERVRFSFCSGSPDAIVGWKQESGKRYLNPQLAISDLRSSVGRTAAQEKCRKCIGTLRHQLNL